MLQALKDEEVINFARKYYALLEKANPERQSFERTKEEKALEALARLTVGDETCAAIGFDGESILVATNNTGHNNIIVDWTVSLEIQPGAYYRCYRGRPCLEIRFGDREKISLRHPNLVYLLPFQSRQVLSSVAIILGKKVFIPHVLKSGRVESLNNDDYEICQELEFTVLPEQHRVPELPHVSVKVNLQQNIPLEDYHEIAVHTLPHAVISNTPFKELKTSIDSLHRRVEVIVEHLSFVAKAHSCPDRLLKKKAVQLAEENRFRVLINSLVWEIVEWYEQAILSKEAKADSGRGKVSQAKKEKLAEHPNLHELLKQLNEHFNSFKEFEKVVTTTSKLVNSWSKKVSKLIRKGHPPFDKVPDYIKQNIDKFIERMKKYFQDIEILEEFVRRDVDKKGRFSTVIAAALPTTQKEMIKVIDDLEQGIHAESRLLWYSRQSGNKTLEFIAISKYSCPHCGLLFYQCGQRIPGVHAKIFPKWPLSNAFGRNFLEKLFGEELYAIYQKLLVSPTKGADGKRTSKGMLVLSVIQSLGTLNTEDIKLFKLGTMHFKNDGEDYASDSEEDSLDHVDDEELADAQQGCEAEPKNDEKIIKETKEESLQEAQAKNIIGPRAIPGWTLQDVEDQGNCFYDGVIHQMQLTNHPFLKEVPEGTLPRDSLRLRIQGVEFKDQEWADDRIFDTLVKEINIILAIVDTRNPEAGFVCYYQGEDGGVITNAHGEMPLPDKPIVRLAATGNHFLSVSAHPNLARGSIHYAFHIGSLEYNASQSGSTLFRNVQKENPVYVKENEFSSKP